MKKLRIAVLNSHPIQYFAPLYAYLNTDPGLEVTALYMTDWSLRQNTTEDPGFGRAVTWNIDLMSGYPSVFLGKAARTRSPGKTFYSLWAPEVWKELRSGRYDALLLPGHQYAANLIAMAAALSMRMPILVRGETHLELPRRGLKALIRRPVMGFFYGLCSRCMAIGTANAAFYRAMGVPPERIFPMPYTVDNARFTAPNGTGDAERAAWRERFAIPPSIPAILYAAKFTRRKHPELVLEAARRLRERTKRPFTIVLCGSGELEPELRAFCATHGLDNVVFTGFVNQAELPMLYGACDVFVLPSEVEPWGLAVNEAMCAGLPIVVSREVGCVADLVSDGVNGFTPEAGDIEGLTGALLKLIENPDLRKSQGAESLMRISRWSYQECMEGLRAALAGLLP
jgi:glycosyltransferase involved in cell wall biosynthesis